jgi:hypothetical protein
LKKKPKPKKQARSIINVQTGKFLQGYYSYQEGHSVLKMSLLSKKAHNFIIEQISTQIILIQSNEKKNKQR